RAAAADRDVIRAPAYRVEGVVLQRRGVEDADLARSESREEERLPVAGHRHVERRRETVSLRRRIESRTAEELGVVNVFIEVSRRYRRAGEHCDPRFGQVALNRVAAENPRSLKANVVERLGVRHINLAAYRVGDHVKQGRSHMRIYSRLRQSVSVDGED